MKNKLIKFMVWILVIIALLGLGVLLVFQHPQFGASANGKRLERMLQSPNYKDGAFQNLSPTPSLTEGYSMPKLIFNFLFKKYPNTQPLDTIPFESIDWNAIDKNEDQIIWLGHSSYILFLSGKTFLIDPVFSNNASPIPGTNNAFPLSHKIIIDDLPKIDVLIITHDHFDHLDYPTVKALMPKVTKVICGLGVGAHLEHWGYSENNIIELDWWENFILESEVTITATPARHFSGRTFKRNTTLFCSYVIKTNQRNIFLGGDSGYDTHFKTIGDKYGPFDLAILENGQYNEAWKYIHALPTDMPKIIKEINAKTILPVHNSKFALAHHHWKEPLETISKICIPNVRIITPTIGTIIPLADTTRIYSKWWEALQ